MSYNKQVGKNGEEIAENFLRGKGYKILQKNFCIQGGEIDIVASLGEVLVFVEVKTRRSKKFGEIIEQISQKKAELLMHTAEVYLEKNNLADADYQIDVITVFLSSSDPEIEHYESAVGFF